MAKPKELTMDDLRPCDRRLLVSLVPIRPHVRVPSEGTEISSLNPSMLTIASWRQFTFEQLTSNDRTPLARMLPKVIGVGCPILYARFQTPLLIAC